MTDEELAVRVWREWRADPGLFVRENFRVTPDAWQEDVLASLLSDPKIALSACKGPGKSAVLAWCIWWILGCHVDAQGYALSVTADNLKDNLWKELSLWYAKSPGLKCAFEIQKKRIISRDPDHADTWWLSARSYAQDADPGKQADSLAGLHGEVCFIVLDECGDMPVGVLAAAKGIFATVGQRAWLLAAGNPTCRDGSLFWIVDHEAASWKIVNITGDPDDPKRSPRIDIAWAREEIAALGRDNPWVMANILGLFPLQGDNQLMSSNLLTLALRRDVPHVVYGDQPIVWGLDPAYSDKSGADESCLARRQGAVAFRPHTWRGLDGTELGDQVAFIIEAERRDGRGPDKIFTDKGGVGVSAYDRLRDLGYRDLVVGVDFGGNARDKNKYADKRTEMWVALSDWAKTGCLPSDNILREEMQTPRYWFRRRGKHTKFCLERKDEMKARGKRSPNRADALALTFAAPVEVRTAVDRARDASGLGRGRAATSYDPFAHRGGQ